MRLEDYDFFLRKSCSLIESKLTILFELLLEDDFKKATERIKGMAGNYERLRILEVDPQDND